MKIKQILVILCVALFPLMVFGEEVDYVVKDIYVKESSTNASKAKKIAIQRGQKQAFDILSERMGIEKENTLWISDEEIEKMVSSIEMNKEKISGTDYEANLTVTFDKEFTKHIFNKHNLTASTQTEVRNKYLVIPTVTSEGHIYVWENENVWMKFWKKSIEDKGIKSIVIPERDIDSLASINAEILSFDNYDDFVYLTEYYDVNSIIVANAEYLSDANKIEIMFTKVVNGKKNMAKLNYYGSEDLDEKELFKNATDKTIDYIVKTENRIARRKSNKDGMIVKVSISGVEDFQKTDSIMKQLDFYDSIKLKSLSKKIAEYQIVHDLDEYAMLTKFEEAGFFVKEKEDGYYLFLKAKYNLGDVL